MTDTNISNFFFIGIAGSGMSALAQFLAMQGKNVSGSDRLLLSQPEHPVIKQLENLGIKVYPQGKGKIPDNALVCVSTAIEDSVPEMKKAKEKKLTIWHRSDLLNYIASQFNTIAVAGTSGKSTTTAMIFEILRYNGYAPSIISGAGLNSLKKKGLTGNAWYGKGQWLVFEADESDGTIVKYSPDTGVLLNVDIDHKDITTLDRLFEIFTSKSKKLVANSELKNKEYIVQKKQKILFGASGDEDYTIANIKQKPDGISFEINNIRFFIPVTGIFNAFNAAAAVAAAAVAGISPENSSEALAHYNGIDRRMEIVEKNEHFTLIDDYAHNPAKIKAAIEAAQAISDKLIIWFQPHGFAPMRLWGEELVETLAKTLRENDTFVMSEIYYAGGSVTKDISAKDYINKLKQWHDKAQFVPKEQLAHFLKENIESGTVILFMGARDPSLNFFAKNISDELKNFFNRNNF